MRQAGCPGLGGGGWCPPPVVFGGLPCLLSGRAGRGCSAPLLSRGAGKTAGGASRGPPSWLWPRSQQDPELSCHHFARPQGSRAERVERGCALRGLAWWWAVTEVRMRGVGNTAAEGLRAEKKRDRALRGSADLGELQVLLLWREASVKTAKPLCGSMPWIRGEAERWASRSPWVPPAMHFWWGQWANSFNGGTQRRAEGLSRDSALSSACVRAGPHTPGKDA